MRQRIFDLVGPAREGDYASRAYDIFIVFIAVVSLIPMLFDTSKTTQLENDVLWVLDVVTAYILLFDYILRWMTHDIKTRGDWKAFVAYPFTPMAIIDILAIMPTLDLVPQALRFLRILRVVKVFRYSRNLLVVTNACYREARTLASVFVAVVVYMFVVALVVFNVEPESFKNFFDALCWACCAMTSVPFSDSRPVGYVGQALSILSSLIALLVVALPAGVITGSYINEVRESKRKGSRYFEMTGKTGFRLSQLESPKVWLHRNRKVLRYITVTVLSIALNTVLSLFLMAVGSPIWLSTLCVALTAFLLEPAAGIVVAFLTTIIATLVQADTTSMLFFFSYAVVALGFGLVFPKENSSHKNLRTLALLLILVFVCGVIQADVHLIRYDGDVHATVDALVSSGFTGLTIMRGMGLPDLPNLFLGTFLDRLDETIPLIILFLILVKLFGVHAAPSERERKQQQEILLERALTREELENEEAREIARDTLERKYEELLKQQKQIADDCEAVRARLIEMDAEEKAARAKSSAEGEESQR